MNNKRTYAHKKRAEIDLTLSENPLGCSPRAITSIMRASSHVHLYPDEEDTLIHALAKHHAIAPNTIFLGAGANQLLEDVLKVGALGKGILVPSATFPESVACISTLQGCATKIPLNSNFTLDLHAMLAAVRSDTAFIHLCNPNNPTGIWTDTKKLLLLAEQSPVPLLISEAGADFVGHSILDHPLHPNIIVVRSFSKSYGLAALRIGYVVAPPKMIALMRDNLGSYRVNSLGIAAAIAALQDQKYLRHSISYILREKKWLMQEMSHLGFVIVPSEGQNFIAQVPPQFSTAKVFCEIVRKQGIAVVDCSLYEGLEKYIRITPQKQKVNKRFILILTKLMEANYEYRTNK